MRITDYQILWGDFLGLQGDVKQQMEEGWRPLGGVSLREGSDGEFIFYQAMVKYETASPVSDFKKMQMRVGG